MGTKYPNQIDGYSEIRIVNNRVDEIIANDHNSLRSAVVAIEQTLGTNPAGSFSTVKDKLEYLDLPPVYDGSSPHSFADGYMLPSSNVGQAITLIVSQLGGADGSTKVGTDAFSTTRGRYTFASGSVDSQLGLVANKIEEQSMLMEQLFSTVVTSGMAVTQGSGYVADVAAGWIVGNGRTAYYTGGTLTPSATPGTYYVYASISELDVVSVSVTATIATAIGTNLDPKVVLAKFTHNGSTWTSSLDMRKYGGFSNTKPFLSVGSDAYGADFTSLEAAIAYVDLVNSLGSIGFVKPTRISIVSDVTLTSLPIALSAGIEIDGGNKTLSWSTDSAIFTINADNVRLTNIATNYTGASGTSACLAQVAGSSTVDNLYIVGCRQKATTGNNLPYFLRIGGSTNQITNAVIKDNVAEVRLSGINLESGATKTLRYSVVSGNMFYQSTKASVANDCITASYFNIIENNYISGGFYRGIYLSYGEDCIVNGNIIDGGTGIVDSAGTAYMWIGIQAEYAGANKEIQCTISDNTVKGFRYSGIYAPTALNCSITGNTVDNQWDSATGANKGIVSLSSMVSGNTVVGDIDVGIIGTNVIGNSILNTSGAVSGIHLAANNSIASGNYISNTSSNVAAMDCYGYSKCIISNNFIQYASGNKSAIYELGDGSIVSGNVLVSGATASGSAGSIKIASSKSNVIIKGNSILSTPYVVINLNSCTGAIIENNDISGDGSTTTYAINNVGDKCSIKNNNMVNCGTSATGIISGSGDFINISSNFISGASGNILSITGKFINIENNSMVSNSAANIKSAIVNVKNNSIIGGNFISGCGTDTVNPTISLGSYSNQIITNNILYDCYGDGISSPGQNGIISDNILLNRLTSDLNPIRPGRYGITAIDNECLVTNNYIKGYGFLGSRLITTSASKYGIIISNNVMIPSSQTTGHFVYIDATNANHIVSNNMFGRTSSTMPNVSAIYCNAATNLVINGNNITGNASTTQYAVYDIGSKSVIQNNIIDGCGTSGTGVIHGNNADYVSICDNLITSAAGNVISLSNGKFAKIENNSIISGGAANILGAIIGVNINSMISNNFIYGCGIRTATPFSVISLGSNARQIVTNNILYDCYGSGINSPGQDSIVSNNMLLNRVTVAASPIFPGDYGIIGIGSESVVSGNYIKGYGYLGSRQIETASATSGSVISSNIMIPTTLTTGNFIKLYDSSNSNHIISNNIFGRSGATMPNVSAIDCTDATNIVIDGNNITGNASTTQYAVTNIGSKTTINNNIMEGCGTISTGAISGTNSDYVKIIDNYINNIAGTVINMSNAKFITVDCNSIISRDIANIKMALSGVATNATILNNFIYGCGRSVDTFITISLASSPNNVVCNNILYDCYGNGINSPGTNSVISNNLLLARVSSYSSQSATGGIAGIGSENVVYGNNIKGYGNNGASIVTTANSISEAIIDSNMIIPLASSTATTGILLGSTNSNCIISNNILGKSGKPIPTTGIDCTSATDIKIINNNMLGDASADNAIKNVGTKTLISGNHIRNFGVSAGTGIIVGTNADYVAIMDGYIDKAAGNVFALNNCKFSKVFGNTIVSTNSANIKSAISLIGANSMIGNNFIFGCGAAANPTFSLGGVERLKINDNFFYDCYGTAINDFSADCVVANNMIINRINTGSYAISGYYSARSVVANNFIYGYGYLGSYDINLSNAANMIVANNSVQGNVDAYGIYLNNVTGVIIGNNLYNNVIGIGVNNSDYLLICNNIIRSYSKYAINAKLATPALRCSISGNFACSPSGANVDGINIDGTTHMLLSGNFAEAAGTGVGLNIGTASSYLIEGFLSYGGTNPGAWSTSDLITDNRYFT